MLAEITCFWRNIYNVLALVPLNSVTLSSDELFSLQLYGVIGLEMQLESHMES